MVVVLFASIANAQYTNVDFEPGGTGADWNWVVGENATNPPLEIIANPVSGGINTTATVAKFTALQAGNPWALVITGDNGEFTFDATNSTVKIMVNKPTISPVGVKFEGLSPAIEIQVSNTLTDEWEELTFDFSGVIGNTYAILVLIPDFDFTPRAQDNIVYFDNIQLPEGTVVGPLPEPTTVPPIPLHAADDVLSIYTEVYPNLPGTDFNPFWNQSTQVTIDYVAAGNNTLKYENLNYQGTQFTNQDVSEYEYIHVDFWTPNSTVLNFYLISPGNETPYALPITPETWVSVDIPLTHYVPPVNLADVFQFKVDGNGTVYFDNWYFWKEPTVPGTDATLSDLLVDGVTVDGFAPGTLAYTIELPIGTIIVPTVTAVTNDPEAGFEIFDAASLPGTTEVVVTAADGETTQTYSVEFTVAGSVPSSEYCETETWHFNNPAEIPSAILLTIANMDANSIIVEIESADADPVDLLIVTGGSGAAISDENTSVPGKISRTLTWASDPPADVSLNILWSKVSFGGNWMLSQTDITVPFAATCEFEGPFDVTFKVDLSQYGGTFTNAYVSGTFNGWSGESNQLLDPDMDNIYEATLVLNEDAYEYKFQLDNWAVQENFVGGEECTVTNGGFTNRYLEVSGNQQLPAVCWNMCDVCPEILYDVTFSVDMNEHPDDYTNVFLNGSFNGWCGDCGNMMADPDMDGIYEITIPLAGGEYEYKFTLDGWTQQENFVGGEECTVTNGGFTNRFIEVSENTVQPLVCWNFCVTCEEIPEPQNVTFKVDLSQYYGMFTNAYVSGSFNGWCGDCNQLLDPDMDEVYEVTLLLDQNSYEYKFTLDNWSVQEEFTEGDPCTITLGGFTNRALLVEEEEVILDVVCWNSCDACPTYQAGWGGISSNVMPEAKISMEDLFAPILDDMEILIGKTGLFWPGQNINTIGDWDTYQGYKVKFTNGVDFEFEGAELTDRTVTLEPGSCYIPVLSVEPASVEEVIVPHGNAIEYVFDIVSQELYWPTGGIVPGVEGALETLDPGFAYLAYVNSTVTLDFGSVPTKSGTMPMAKHNFINNTNWNDVSRTGIQHIISVAAANLEASDIVGVFTAEGSCTGMSQYNGVDKMMLLVVNGNDVTTEVVDGMTQNEAMSFKIFRNGTELEVSPVYSQDIANHDGLFAENGLSIISEFKIGATGINATKTIAFSIFPNPGNGRFNITMANVDGCDITVMNIRGQQVYSSLVNGSTMLDLSDQPKGVYFVRLSNASSTSIEKIVIE